MAVFRFRLRASLKLADQALQRTEQRLAEELQKLNAFKENQWMWQKRLRDALREKKAAGQTAPAELGRWQAYTQRCDQSLRSAQEQMKKQEEVVIEARQAVLEANREVEKLKRLKEKQWRAFLEEEQKKEQKILDETGQILYQLQKKEVIF
ncbi:MAG: flagellar export protein FliJ [Peptococcaceae bacterium]|nr:flagellar export protein FliJ [Peptococcaceae bacterium]